MLHIICKPESVCLNKRNHVCSLKHEPQCKYMHHWERRLDIFQDLPFFVVFALLWTSYFRPAYTHLDRTSLVNKGYIISPKPKVCLREKASNTEWTRYAIMHAQAANRHSVGLHFARSQSQPYNKRTLKTTWLLPWSNGKRKINTNLVCETLEGEHTCIH